MWRRLTVDYEATEQLAGRVELCTRATLVAAAVLLPRLVESRFHGDVFQSSSDGQLNTQLRGRVL